jgi:ubiquinone/menaquinone biosynthesis C-methylase UbiE
MENISNDKQTIGSNPVGLKGRFAGIIMNLIHANQYKKIIQRHIIDKIDTTNHLSILDVGCGGGKVISLFSSMLEKSKIYGIDHSVDMINLSSRVNKASISDGTVNIVQGNVNKLPYSDDFFDVVTAFDSINFWNDFDNSIIEIKRVLKQNGIFLIVNGYPKEGTKWWNFVKFKNDNEYRAVLSKHGFKKIDITIEKNTIIILTNK